MMKTIDLVGGLQKKGKKKVPAMQIQVVYTEENSQLAYHFWGQGYKVMVESEHFELRIFGEIKIKKGSSLKIEFFKQLGDRALESFISEVEEMPYYVIIEKATQEMTVCEGQLVSEAYAELRDREIEYVSEEEVDNFLKLSKKLNP